MNVFVLSELNPNNKHVGWSVGYTLETVLASTCEAKFIYPVNSDQDQWLSRYQQRIFKSWYEIPNLSALDVDRKDGPNVLLVISLTPRFLLAMHALGELLNQFDLKIAYCLDGFSINEIDRTTIPHLDHIFTICSETADEIRQNLGVSASFLPLGADVLKYGSNQFSRSIDIFGYGRKDVEVHQHLKAYYNHQQSKRLYCYSSFSGGLVEDLGEHLSLHYKLLARSKISLCFEASSVGRFQGRSPILYRWFEGWAAGCTLVGRRPFGKGTADLMDWENSTIEIPDSPDDWIPFFEDLLNDKETLLANSQRNYYECLIRHDWRYRIREMLRVLYIPTPKKLEEEIDQLHQKLELVTNLAQVV